MTIVVEDGTEVSGANSYAAHTDLADYADLRGVTLSATQSDREELLIKAMDALQGRPWQGVRVTTTQALAWPRWGVYRDQQLLASDEIPRELFYGQLALALAAIDVDLMPTQEAQGKGAVIGERVEGAVDLKYANDGNVRSVAADASAEALLKVLEVRSGLRIVRA